MIPVTKPFLPLQEMYSKHLYGIWQCLCETNMGPLAVEFEMKLKEYLHVNHNLFVTSGMVALQISEHKLIITKKHSIFPHFKTCKL